MIVAAILAQTAPVLDTAAGVAAQAKPFTKPAIEVLAALTLAGLLGMAGQAVRAVSGLKKMSDEAQRRGVGAFDLFIPSRLVISLIIGFVAGMVAAVSLGFSNLFPVDLTNTQFLMGLAAAGYAGTDFLEAFARNLAGRSKSLLPVELQVVSVPEPVLLETTPMSGGRSSSKKKPARRKSSKRRQ